MNDTHDTVVTTPSEPVKEATNNELVENEKKNNEQVENQSATVQTVSQSSGVVEEKVIPVVSNSCPDCTTTPGLRNPSTLCPTCNGTGKI